MTQQYCWMKKGTVMKFSSISTVRSSASALVLAGTVFLGVSGIAHAQGSNTSGQGGYNKENPADYTDKKDPIKGHTGEGYGSPTEKSKAGSTKRSEQGSGRYDKENPADYTDKKDPIQGHTGEPYSEKSSSEKGKEGGAKRNPKDKYYGMPKEKEEMDTGYVDQKKRSERATDARSPSPDPHVPDFPKDKQGRPMKDLKDEQGGPIGPN
jgi:hypothetical protein